jgi:hypothetical protein
MPGQDPLIFQRVIIRNAQHRAIRSRSPLYARIELSGDRNVDRAGIPLQ